MKKFLKFISMAKFSSLELIGSAVGMHLVDSELDYAGLIIMFVCFTVSTLINGRFEVSAEVTKTEGDK